MMAGATKMIAFRPCTRQDKTLVTLGSRRTRNVQTCSFALIWASLRVSSSEHSCRRVSARGHAETAASVQAQQRWAA